MDFLILYAEIMMAFVAFATIVATLRQAFGKQLSPFQTLLFRLFVEVGLLFVIAAMIPIAMIETGSAERDVWLVSTLYNLIASAIYLPYYLMRRRKVESTTPLVSRLVQAGYGIAIILLLATIAPWFWSPSLTTTIYFLLWGLISNIAMFMSFIGSFVEIGGGDED